MRPTQRLAAIAQGFGDMDARDGILAVEIGERACDEQRAVLARAMSESASAASRKSVSPARSGAAISSSIAPSHSALARIRASPSAGVALDLHAAGMGHPRAPGRFPRRPAAARVGGGHGRHFDLQVDAVEHRHQPERDGGGRNGCLPSGGRRVRVCALAAAPARWHSARRAPARGFRPRPYPGARQW
jgi:hypothetical protein